MKLNISYPATACQKIFDIVDGHKIRMFYDKRIGSEVDGSALGEEWKSYIFKITGGNDKQGFPMKQGVLTTERVRLLLSGRHSGFFPRREGERKRKSVRGCIVDSHISALSLVIVRKGDKDIDGLTNINIPRRLGPKRASNIRKLFNLSKQDNVRQYVIKRSIFPKDGKPPYFKAPKIQRLITPQVLQRKRFRLALKKRRCLKRKELSNAYKQIMLQRHKESMQKRQAVKRRRSISLHKSKTSINSN